MALTGKKIEIVSSSVFFRKKITAILIFCVIASAASSTPEEYTAKILDSNTDFSNALFRALKKDENLIFSPFSAHSLLTLAYQGSEGQTREAFASALKLPQPEQAAEGYKSVVDSTKGVQDVAFHVANKIYVTDRYKLSDSFARTAVDSFDAEAESVDFSESAQAANAMNSWIANKTNEKIRDLVQANSLDAETALVLLNAVYFKGEWMRKFKATNTKPQAFYLRSGETKEVDMMHLYNEMLMYSENSELNAKMVELPYANRNFRMVLVLPNEKNGIGDLKAKLFESNLKSVFSQKHSVRRVNVTLPKFKIESSLDLKPALTDVRIILLLK